MEKKPKRRWGRFGLRTLFVLVTLVAVWLGWTFHWIRQRHEFLESGRGLAGYRADGELTRAPRLLWLFGEEGYHAVYVMGDDNSVKEARRLFPEASFVGTFVMFKPRMQDKETKRHGDGEIGSSVSNG